MVIGQVVLISLAIVVSKCANIGGAMDSVWY